MSASSASGSGHVDIAIIGGGINGCGIARDAAGRGLSVFLAEKQDLAIGTSSASTKLIHGGLRYLEHYEFRLVREALSEREVLWSMAPHIIRPLRFILPHHKDLRPALLIRLGLFIYDHLGGRKRLPPSWSLDLKTDEAGVPLKPMFTKGFEYSDCSVDDSRLVVLNAMDAADRGADIRVRTEVVSATRQEDHWEITVVDTLNGQSDIIRAKAIVNAAGPWVLDVISNKLPTSSGAGIRLVKGSHIVVPRIFEHDRAYIFQNADQRIIFAIPYEHDFTLIGTTDIDYQGQPDDVAITDDEIEYLCSAASEYFTAPISPSNVTWAYSGVRPLYDDGASAAQELTRDYVLNVDGGKDGPVILNIFGGKITTYRCLAEDVLGKLAAWFPRAAKRWTAGVALPGGDFPIDGQAALIQSLSDTTPALPESIAERWTQAYGTRALTIAPGAKTDEDLGICFGAGLYQCEVEYLIHHEWAMTADDIMWRRTKLGLRLTETEKSVLAQWLSDNYSERTIHAA